LLGVSLLICLVGLEAGAALRLRWLHRSPEPPSMRTEAAKAPLHLPTGFQPEVSGPASQALRILVIGESSARGDPYDPWLSVGQILGWQLERVFPGRPVQVEMWAEGGVSLESMHQKLADLTYRPDILLLFAGHNEFQARYQWARYPPYYLDVHPRRPETSLVDLVLRSSPYCRLILETLDRQLIDATPVQVAAPQVVDVPVCTEEEKAAIVSDFHRRVEAIATYCDVIGSLPLFIIPASNDGDYDPNRSILPAATPRAEREAFARQFARARAMEQTEPAKALAAFRALVDRYPGFAETHYRMARLLEQSEAWDEARRHFVRARELDAMPMRCPEVFRQVFRDVAARHPRMVLVDSASVLGALSPHGILDDHLYHDAQHPTFRGYLALAQDLLNQLHDRQALDWPAAVTAPIVDPDECASHFQLDRSRWAHVCYRSWWFYGATALMRHDPTERRQRSGAYSRAEKLILAGTPPEQTGITGFGVHPAGLP
jgi:hypothetical protein